MLALGIVFGAAITAPIVLLFVRGKGAQHLDAAHRETQSEKAKAGSLEVQLTAERDGRAKDAEAAKREVVRLEALRAQSETKLNQHAETTGHAQAKAQAAEAQLDGIKVERDRARTLLTGAEEKIATLQLDLAAATTRANHAEASKLQALGDKDDECQRHLQTERTAAVQREQGLKDGHDAALLAVRSAGSTREGEHEKAITLLKEAHAKTERSISESHARELQAKQNLIDELTTYIAKCDETLKQTFGDASAKALNEALKGFDDRAQARFKDEQDRAGARSEQEKREIERLLEPMHKELESLDMANKRMEESRVKAEGALDEKLQRIQQTSESLANALRKPGVRGTWGEEQLKKILDSAGMTEGVHYRVQDHTEEEGEALRTDFIIMLPKDREVVIDSKAPLLQYEAAMNASSEEDRVRYSEAHARAVRGHFKTLKSKEYWRRYPGSPDCVFLFIPYEGAYQMACEHDKQLLSDCHAQKVILANPMTLMSLVHVAAYALQEDRMKGDIEQVRTAATTLCERLGKVFTLINKHRGHLASAVESYNGVVASIEGRLIPSTKTMERLGIGDARMTNIPSVIQANIRILPVAEI